MSSGVFHTLAEVLDEWQDRKDPSPRCEEEYGTVVRQLIALTMWSTRPNGDPF